MQMLGGGREIQRALEGSLVRDGDHDLLEERAVLRDPLVSLVLPLESVGLAIELGAGDVGRTLVRYVDLIEVELANELFDRAARVLLEQQRAGA